MSADAFERVAAMLVLTRRYASAPRLAVELVRTRPPHRLIRLALRTARTILLSAFILHLDCGLAVRLPPYAPVWRTPVLCLDPPQF